LYHRDPDPGSVVRIRDRGTIAQSAAAGYSSTVTTITADSHIALSKDQASCDLAGETAIVNLMNGVYYGLDPMGTHIWKLLREPLTFAALCDSLIHDYDVEASRLESDMREFLNDLADQGLVDIT
jgi:Coenzyme PQQ synthesis protein D (PqqD)